MLRNHFLAGMIAIVSFAAKGADLYSPQFGRCINDSGGVTIQMIDCIGAELKIQDAKLNANYKQLMSQIPDLRKKELLETQRAWLKFRELNCKFYYDPEGGTNARVASNECFLRSTTERAKELQDLAP